MRLEQLVLHGPTDDDRIRFDAGITVFGGLSLPERARLIGTVVDALSGRLANSSVVFADNRGDRIFADRTGATYATTGNRAAEPGELLGRDPGLVRELLVVTADDLGLGATADAHDLTERVARARHDAERARAELDAERRSVGTVVDDDHRLADLDRAIDRSRDDAARWNWVQQRRRLDELRAELAIHQKAERRPGERQLLDAVDSLRAAGEAWTAAAHEASALRLELGDLPAVSERDLALVARTPDDIPDRVLRDLDAWREARTAVDYATAALERATTQPPTPDDPLVAAFSAIDQALLWPVHRELLRASEAYDTSVETLDRAELDADLEARVEAAHVEVVRRQRRKDLLFRPGMLGATLLAVGALLAGRTISVILGSVILVAAVAMASWLLTVPRRALARAEHEESLILEEAGVDSWLGVHMRRLDTVADHAERRRLTQAANDRAAAMADWLDLAGDLDPADLTACAEAVWEYTDAVNPVAAKRRAEDAQEALEAATELEAASRKTVTAELTTYGVPAASVLDLDPAQLARLLDGRVEAGRIARDAQRLAALQQLEERVGAELDGLLTRLGFEGGELGDRLDRAIVAVSAARARTATDRTRRPREVIEREIVALAEQLAASRQPSWDRSPDPEAPPVSPEELSMRRLELAEQIAARNAPDVVGAERRLELAESHLADLEGRLAAISDPAATLEQRLVQRLSRTTTLGGVEAPAPVILDDALADVAPAERLDLLDLLYRLSTRTQVIILTDDPAVSMWARERAMGGSLTLYEASVQPAQLPPVPVAPVHVGRHP